MSRLVLVLALVLAASTARAQTSSERRLTLKRAMPAQMMLASLATLAVGAGTYSLTAAPVRAADPGTERVLLAASLPTLTGLPLSATLSAGIAQGVGKHYEVEGSYWRAWGFGLLGTALGSGTGLALGGFLLRDRPLALPFATIGLAGAGGALGATLGYDGRAHPAFERVARRMSPKVAMTDDKKGALLSVSGTF